MDGHPTSACRCSMIPIIEVWIHVAFYMIFLVHWVHLVFMRLELSIEFSTLGSLRMASSWLWLSSFVLVTVTVVSSKNCLNPDTAQTCSG